eukprot:7379743-Prymnesium_polylepis.1
MNNIPRGRFNTNTPTTITKKSRTVRRCEYVTGNGDCTCTRDNETPEKHACTLHSPLQVKAVMQPLEQWRRGQGKGVPFPINKLTG